jgi:Excalibur calcium-binding domain
MRSKLAVLLIAAASAATAVVGAASTPAAPSAIPYLWPNCKHVNARYPHGVGKRFAHDKTSGVPVTNFRRSTLLYLRAMSYNRGLDRDRTGSPARRPSRVAPL